MANEKVVVKQGLAGGTSSDLDSISYTAMTDDNVALVEDGEKSYYYIYDSSSSAAEESPFVIAPDDVGAGTGRWLLRPDYSYYNDNLLLNPEFLVNQDVYTFGTTIGTANIYLLDGWFSDSALGAIIDNVDGTYSVVSLLQALDRPDLGGEIVTISATITNAGSLAVYEGGVDSKSSIGTLNSVGSLTSSVSSLTFSFDLGGKTYPAIKIDGSGAKFHSLKLEVGRNATRYAKTPFIDELSKCQSQYWKTYSYATAVGTATNKGRLVIYNATAGANKAFLLTTPPRAMRADPTVTIYSTNDGATGKMYSTADAANVDAAASKNENSINLVNSGAVTANGIVSCHIDADARI
jgi:hypothetical protein